MNPHLSIKVGLRHGCDPRSAESWEVIGKPLGVSEARNDFMPYRLKKTDARFECVLLCPLEVEREQRFTPEADSAAATDAVQPKQSKSRK